MGRWDSVKIIINDVPLYDSKEFLHHRGRHPGHPPPTGRHKDPQMIGIACFVCTLGSVENNATTELYSLFWMAIVNYIIYTIQLNNLNSYKEAEWVLLCTGQFV